MGSSSQKSKFLGAVIGIFVAGASVFAVFFLDWGTEPPKEPPLIRPLKTMTIQSSFAALGRKFPGKVRANQEVNLAFQVAGPLVEFDVKKGDGVGKGDLLARIDPRDFQNALDAASAKFAEAKVLWVRIERLYQEDRAQQVEYEQHKRAYNVAKAVAEQATKDLEDTYLRAPFAGLIANTFVKNFQNVRAKEPILSLQDVVSVEIEINVPEERVALGMKNKDDMRLVATFDYLPGREFQVTLKEYATEADPLTQTYLVTLAMPAPRDVTILPGMTATVRSYPKAAQADEDAGYAVPIDAVPIDGLGNYHVWKVEAGADGTSTVHRAEVEVGEIIQSEILIVKGLERGDRIALAGVHLLEEGQRVRPLDEATGPTQSR